MQQSVRVRFCIGSLLQRRCKAIYKNSDLHTMQIAVFDCLSFLMRQAHHEEASIDFFLWVRRIVFALSPLGTSFRGDVRTLLHLQTGLGVDARQRPP